MIKPLVVIEVLGGIVDNVVLNNGEDLRLRVVDWDDLEDEGLRCPKCRSTNLRADLSTQDDYFFCNKCRTRFLWDASEVAEEVEEV